jgi:hypothetical protein
MRLLVDQGKEPDQMDANPCSPFETLEITCRLLSSGPACLALDGRRLGHGLPARPIPLLELRALLQHPATGDGLRSAVLEELVHRATRQGGRWVVAFAGVLLPGLRSIAAKVASVDHRGADSVEADLLESVRDMTSQPAAVGLQFAGSVLRAIPSYQPLGAGHGDQLSS